MSQRLSSAERTGTTFLAGLALGGAALLGGCATVFVSSVPMDNSMATIRAADELGAANVPLASLHLQLAKEEAAQATALDAKKDSQRASYVWMRAEADADLALALAREAAAHNEAQASTDKLNAPK